jgi:glucan-binding YG repeat protein
MQTTKTTTKKRRLALFVALVMALSLWTALPLQASALDVPAQIYTDQSDGIMYYLPAHTDTTASTTKATIIGYTGSAATLVVPDRVSVNGIERTVNVIAPGAFAASSSLQTVTLSADINNINPYAFYACTELTSVTFQRSPSERTDISDYAFYNCTKLTMTESGLPPDGARGTNIFGKDASVSTGTVTGANGNYRCSVVNGTATLWNFTGDPTAASIPLNVTVGVTSYPVTGLGAGLFNRRALLTAITIPGTVTNIGSNAFRDTALSSVIIPDSVESIGSYAFSCRSLGTVTISGTSNLTRIEGAAFYNCALTSITIPDGVTSIEEYTFSDCTALQTVTISGTSGLTSIGNSAFATCRVLTSIAIPDGVTSIGSSAFASCALLETVNIPDGITSIGASTFGGCRALESIEIPDSVESIGANAFINCVELESVNIPDAVTSISDSTFSGCAALANITIPDRVTTIGANAFNGTALTEIEIPEGVTAIGSLAFYNSTSLDKVVILSKRADDDIATNAFNSTGGSLKIWRYLGNAKAQEVTAARPGAGTVIMIEGITLDETEFDLTNSTGMQTLTATSVPTVAEASPYTLETMPSVTWSTSNSSVATVDSGGLVTAGSTDGGVKITASVTTRTGVKTADANVTVSMPGVQQYSLTVEPSGSTGGGSFAASAPVTITAADVEGQRFVEWVTDNGGTFAPNATSAEATFTMPAFTEVRSEVIVTAKYKYETPNAAIDYAAEELTNLIAGETYTFGGVEGVAESGIYAIDSSWLNSTLSIVKKSDGSVADSTAQSLPIPARPIAPTGIATTDQTTAGQDDGTITGVTTAMQYSANGGSSWTDVLGTEITGLAPGSYQVRTKATNSDFASAAATLTIAAYEPPTPPPAATTYAVTVTNGTGSASYEEGATVTITANTPATGKVFDTWTSDDVTFASATSATTTFTMPNHAVAVTATYKDDPNTGGGDDPNPPVDPPATENGWVQNEDGEWEYLVDGEAKTGWVYDQSTWYYTNSDGIMQTGWEYVGSSWYYLAGNGEMKTGWVKDKNTWYYLTGSGAMKTGWQKDNGSWYYLGGNGSMVVSKWLHDTDGSWYYLSGNGKMLTGKQKIGAKTYTFKANGVWVS